MPRVVPKLDSQVILPDRMEKLHKSCSRIAGASAGERGHVLTELQWGQEMDEHIIAEVQGQSCGRGRGVARDYVG